MFKLKGLSLFALVAAILFSVPTALAQGRIVEITCTLPGGGTGTNYVSTAFANAVTRDISSTLRLLAVDYSITGTSLTAAKTITLKRSATGRTYKTVTVATNVLTGVSFETNEWYWIKPDVVYVYCTATNAGTVKLICTEQ